ncbi:hypothetical protein ARMA_2602 [Ardenticatena maritima]|uniref:Uncharacterized protein n=1 Tax=Ardenticatena maritima TaxID=872965 RepID=A0A0M8KB79_9CHLR|nr:hypothetical protein ARMA_2602 [Ardenticatena maritima]
MSTFVLIAFLKILTIHMHHLLLTFPTTIKNRLPTEEGGGFLSPL